MGSRRRIMALGAQAAVLLCGAGAALAFAAHLYATALVLLLCGVWAGAELAWTAARAAPAPAPHAEEEALQFETEKRTLSTMVDQSPAPLVSVRADGVIHAANRAARGLFSTDDVLRPAPASLLHALREGAPGERRVVRIDRGAETRSYALSVADITLSDGPMRLASLQDIGAELKAAEAATLRELLQVLSHEIMNSLTPLSSLAASAEELLASEPSADAQSAREAIAILARRAEGLTRFAEGYRTMARLPPPVLVRSSVRDLVEEAGRLFAVRWTDRGVTLRLRPPVPDVIMPLDPDLIGRALANLMANAAEATLEGGVERPQVELSGASRAEGVVFVIEDNGPGICDEHREAIFRPFFTTRAAGTGVGLSLARQIALSHGGDLVAAPGSAAPGARFELAV